MMALTDDELARLDKIVHERPFQTDADRTIVLGWAVDVILNRRLAESWDECVQQMYDLGWMHDYALEDAKARNPYRNAREKP